MEILLMEITPGDILEISQSKKVYAEPKTKAK
jgi:hypothetical protein